VNTANEQLMLRGGLQQVRFVLRAMALLQLDAGLSAPEVAHVVPLTDEAIRRAPA
jgi:hypothetical protein